MAMLEKIKAEYLSQNPMKNVEFVYVPEWVEAIAAVLDPIQAEITALKNEVKYGKDVA